MSAIKHLYGQQGNRWLPKDTSPGPELVAVECCGRWLVLPSSVGDKCSMCGAPMAAIK